MVSSILSIEGSKSKIMAASKIEQCRLDLVEVWRKMPYKGVFLGLLGAWVVLFHFLGNSTLGYVHTPSLFGWWIGVHTQGLVTGEGSAIVQVLSSEEGFAWVIPLVVFGMLWWKRTELMALPKQIWWPSLLIFVLAMAVHILGYMVQQTRISVVGFFIGIYGLVGAVWGLHVLRATFFPMFLFAFCLPLGGTLGNSMTLPLRIMAAKITQLVSSGLFGIHV